MDSARAKKLKRQFGKRIARLRQEHDWTPEQLAQKTGLATSRVLKIEAGEGHVTLTIIGRFVEAFHIMPGDVLDKLDL